MKIISGKRSGNNQRKEMPKEPGKACPALKYQGKADIMINRCNTEEISCK